MNHLFNGMVASCSSTHDCHERDLQLLFQIQLRLSVGIWLTSLFCRQLRLRLGGRGGHASDEGQPGSSAFEDHDQKDSFCAADVPTRSRTGRPLRVPQPLVRCVALDAILKVTKWWHPLQCAYVSFDLLSTFWKPFRWQTVCAFG